MPFIILLNLAEESNAINVYSQLNQVIIPLKDLLIPANFSIVFYLCKDKIFFKVKNRNNYVQRRYTPK